MNTVTTLTKVNLSNHLIKDLGVAKKDADLLVNSFLESIITALHKGEHVELRGFGSFRLRNRKERRGRNPRNGKSVYIPSKKVVYFKLGKKLRNQLID